MSKAMVYTDGGARTVDGEYHAGWGYHGCMDDDESNAFQGHGPIGKDGTNNQGELHALHMAIEAVMRKKIKYAEFHSDSTHALDGITANMHKQVKKGWLTVAGLPIKNLERWQAMLELHRKFTREGFIFKFTWVKGHSGIPGNEIADDLATAGLRLSRKGLPAEIIDKIAVEVSDVKEEVTEDYIVAGNDITIVTPGKYSVVIQTTDADVKLIDAYGEVATTLKATTNKHLTTLKGTLTTCAQVCRVITTAEISTNITLIEAKDVRIKKPKAPIASPMVTGRRVCLLSNTPSFRSSCDKYAVVYSTNYENDKKTVERYYGVEDVSTHQCVTFLKEKDFLLEMIEPKVSSVVTDKLILPAIVYWDKLNSSRSRQEFFNKERELQSDGYLISTEFKTVDKFNDILTMSCPLAIVLKFPRRAWAALSHMEIKYTRLTNILNDVYNDTRLVDITDSLFDTDKSGKMSLVPELKGVAIIPLTVLGRKIILTCNIDIPVLTKMQSMIRINGDLTVKILFHGVSDKAYRYSIYMSSGGEHALMDSPYANVVYL